MRGVLVIGASGFVGRHLARALLAQGHVVRCLARDPDKIADLKDAGCEVVQGDIADAASIDRAMARIDAVYVSIHTLSPQPGNSTQHGYMDLEAAGLRNVVAACQAHGARRVIYVTSLGIAPDAASSWTRGRWKTEQYLLTSGLDATAIRPGQIVGAGGQGFMMLVGQASKSTAIVMGSGQNKARGIAIDDLVYYLTGVLDRPEAFGKAFEVGCDETYTTDQMIDITAQLLGRKAPRKLHIPAGLLRVLAPLIERMTKFPKGAVAGALDAMKADLDGDPMPIRKLLPRPPLSYREAVRKALETAGLSRS